MSSLLAVFIVVIVLAVYTSYKKEQKRKQYLEKFERVCHEHAMVVDRIVKNFRC